VTDTTNMGAGWGTAQSTERPRSERGWRRLRRAAYQEHTHIQQQLADSQQQLAASQQQLAATQQQLAAAQQALAAAQVPVRGCPICLNPMPDTVVAVTYSCGHVCCRACAQAWSANHPECPYCNSQVAWGGIQGPHLRLHYV